MTTSNSNTQATYKFNSDKAIKLINTFDGTRSKLHNFIDSVDFVYSKFDQREIEIFPLLVKSRLEGPALEFIGSRDFNSWVTIKIALLEQYGEILDIHCLNFELCHFKQNFNEKPINFIERVENQLIRIYKVIKYDISLNEVEKKCLTNFHDKSAILTSITGLKDPLSQVLRSLKPNSLAEIKQLIIDYQNQQYFKQTNTQFSKLNINSNSEPHFNTSPQLSTDNTRSQSCLQKTPLKITISKCRVCNKFGHKADTCYNNAKPQISVNSTLNAEHNDDVELEIDQDFLYENSMINQESPPAKLEFSK